MVFLFIFFFQFFKNVHTYPHEEFKFSKSSVDKSEELNNDDSAEHAIQTKIITLDREGQGTSIRGQIFQDYDSILINETYEHSELIWY